MHWRQGDFVEPKDLASLNISVSDKTRVIVISHSCDLAGTDEESAELLIGEIVLQSQHSNGHSIKWLDVTSRCATAEEIVRFKITDKTQIDKTKLLELAPSRFKLGRNELSILKRWLAQRYSRAEFPDSFIARLNSNLGGSFEKWAKKHSAALTGVYFGLIDDAEITDENESYELKIFLVFASAIAENETNALSAQSELNKLFNHVGNQSIKLVGCILRSDAEFDIKSANTYKRWRFEHRSIKGEPLDQLD